MPDIIQRNAECARQLLEAGAEIEKLRADLRMAINSDGEYAKAMEADNEKLRAILRDAPGVDVDLVVPDRDYTAMSPLDCYEAGMLDAAFRAREAIRAYIQTALSSR